MTGRLNQTRRQFVKQQLKRGLTVLPDVRVLDSTSARSVNAHYGLTMVLENRLAEHRNEVIHRLKEVGVGTSVYYPQPVPRMTYYREKYGYNASRYPVATEIADHSIEIPDTDELIVPILATIPLQLISYHIAVMRECNVDQPRNLAKSVTVE